MPVAAHETTRTAKTAIHGAPAGGFYEFAVACDQIALMDNGSCLVSPVEVSRLTVPPRATGVQNRIFTRLNASGPDGALRRFGTGRKGDFDFERV